MAAVNSKTRLSPPLMHVFGRRTRPRTPRKAWISATRPAIASSPAADCGRAKSSPKPILRREVSRDLEALLNAVALESTIDMTETPYARKSIINFGLPDISNRTIDENAVNSIPAEIKTAIINYEPRLAAASLEVERDTTVDPAELKVRFIVRADLTCEPVHVPVEFVADVVDTGKVIINRL